MSDSTTTSTEARLAVFGEVLFDHFEDGGRVLGGAPFNVAWHLRSFGAHPLLISRIGADEPGQAIRRACAEVGIETSALQLDPDAPTGHVQVTVREGSPGYTIPPGQAWDRIEPLPDTLSALSHLYHGSLALREPGPRRALAPLRQRSRSVFCDLNLRSPYEPETLAFALRGVTVLKLNRGERQRLETLFPDLRAGDDRDFLLRAHERFGTEELLVTKDREGASWVDLRESAPLNLPAPEVEVQDTVGAGDAVSAIWLLGLERRWEPEVRLERALDFAALICTHRGAVLRDPAIYAEVMGNWS